MKVEEKFPLQTISVGRETSKGGSKMDSRETWMKIEISFFCFYNNLVRNLVNCSNLADNSNLARAFDCCDSLNLNLN